MKATEMFSMNIKPGTPVMVCLRDSGGKERTVHLFFRGYRIGGNEPLAHSPSDLVPVFSPPNAKGKMSRRHYSSVPTTFENIISIKEV